MFWEEIDALLNNVLQNITLETWFCSLSTYNKSPKK